MKVGKRRVSERAAMARLRRVLAKEGGKVGYHRTTGYYLFADGSYTENGTATDFEGWCRAWGALAVFEALED